MDLRGYVLAFDLDGTLVDTAPDIIGALNVVLHEEGITPLSSRCRPAVDRARRHGIDAARVRARRPSAGAEQEAPLLDRMLTEYEPISTSTAAHSKA